MLPVLLIFLLPAASYAEWDLAVLTTTHLELLGETMAPVTSMAIGIKNVSAFAYDPLYLHHYFAATGHPNASIFRVQVSRDGRTGPIEPLVKKQPGRVYGLAYDAETTSVFWTSSNKILKSQLDLDLTDGEIIHNFENDRPLSIVVEPCSRYIYWSYRKNYIDRSYMDGSNKERVVEGLFLPIAITISQAERRIYWIDEGPGTTYRIGRALLDGSNKEIIFPGIDQQPSSLVVAAKPHGSTVYWTDKMSNQLWSLRENSTAPEAVHTFDQTILALTNAKSFEHLDNHVCSQLIVMRDQVPYSAIIPTAGSCVHGTFSTLSGSCVCTPGYIGALCETSICYNHCLTGTCHLIDRKPVCRCPPGRSGERCEINSCLGYCYNGKCSISEEHLQVCDCHEGWYGPQCNVSKEFCAFACSSGFDEPSCNCSSSSIAAALTASMDFGKQFKLPFIIAVSGCAFLTLVVFILAILFCKQRRRPRMRKFYKVTPRKGDAPQPVRTSPDCEIAIENCCNMNICETPCYEPELRPAGGKNKKEEKRGLLKEMEVQPDCGKTF